MKQILSVKSNAYYYQEDGKEFKLKPSLELIIAFTDGKDYDVKKDGYTSKIKISETRMIVSPELLQDLITDLQLHQKKLEGFRKNSDQINSLIKYVQEGEQHEKQD